PHRPSWSIFVAGVWAGTVLLPRVVRLWHAGYSWRDVLARPPAPDAIEARLAAGGRRPVELPRATTDEFGPEAEAIQQARRDPTPAGGRRARPAGEPAQPPASGADRPAHATPTGSGPARVVRAGDAERAVRPAPPALGRRGGGAGRPHARDAAGARAVTRC